MARRIHFSIILSLILFSSAFACKASQVRPSRPNEDLTEGALVDTLVVPDLVFWSIGINDQADTMEEAKKSSDRKLAAVLEVLEDLEIVEGTLRTAPARSGKTRMRCDEKKKEVEKFYVNRQVVFQQADPDRAAQVHDELIVIEGIGVSYHFDLGDYEEILIELRKRALDKAWSHLSTLAGHAGIELDGIRDFRFEDSMAQPQMERARRQRGGQPSGPKGLYIMSRVWVTAERK